MGCPSKVTLNWLVCGADGEDQDCKLALTCEFIIDEEYARRELTILEVEGDPRAVMDFKSYAVEAGLLESAFVGQGLVEEDSLHDVAECLGAALLLGDAKAQYPDLFVIMTAECDVEALY